MMSMISGIQSNIETKKADFKTDLDRLVEVHRCSKATAYPEMSGYNKIYLNPDTLKKRWQKRLSSSSAHHTFVALSAKDIIGFASTEMLTAAESELTHLYVLPDFWGMGVGAHLCLKTEQFLARNGYNQINLWVLKGSKAELFYRKQSFHYINEEKAIEESSLLSGDFRLKKYRKNIDTKTTA